MAVRIVCFVKTRPYRHLITAMNAAFATGCRPTAFVNNFKPLVLGYFGISGSGENSASGKAGKLFVAEV